MDQLSDDLLCNVLCRLDHPAAAAGTCRAMLRVVKRPCFYSQWVMVRDAEGSSGIVRLCSLDAFRTHLDSPARVLALAPLIPIDSMRYDINYEITAALSKLCENVDDESCVNLLLDAYRGSLQALAWAVHEAVRAGHRRSFYSLMAYCRRHRDDPGYSSVLEDALVKACSIGNALIVRDLLSMGARVKGDPLASSVTQNNAAVANALLDAGVTVTMKSISAVVWWHDTCMLRKLLRRVADVNEDGGTALVTAVRICNVAAVKLLLGAGSDPYARHGQAIVAASFHPEILELLLLKTPGRVISTDVLLQCIQEHCPEETVRILLPFVSWTSAGADAALKAAVRFGSLEIFELVVLEIAAHNPPRLCGDSLTYNLFRALMSYERDALPAAKTLVALGANVQATAERFINYQEARPSHLRCLLGLAELDLQALLCVAVARPRAGCVEVILEHAKSSSDILRSPILIHAINSNTDVKCLEILYDSGFFIPPEEFHKLMSRLCHGGASAEVVDLVSKRAGVSGCHLDAFLLHAVLTRSTEVLMTLLKNGADAGCDDALIMACRIGNLDAARILLSSAPHPMWRAVMCSVACAVPANKLLGDDFDDMARLYMDIVASFTGWCAAGCWRGFRRLMKGRVTVTNVSSWALASFLFVFIFRFFYRFLLYFSIVLCTFL